jgi:ligand-binding sensor domain-containing protein/two-component sensor histidine kinase
MKVVSLLIVQGLRVSRQRLNVAGFLALPLICIAAGCAAAASEYSVRAWQIEDGLPQNSVTSIAQTPDGYLWLATFNGLARFDGVRFTVYDEGNVPALPSSRLVRLDVDEHGALWIQTEEGALVRFREGAFKEFSAREGLPAVGAAGMARGPKGRVLLVDRSGGVCGLEGDEWIAQPQYDFLRGNRLSFWTDEQENLWVWGRDGRGFGRVIDREVHWLKAPEGPQNAYVRSYAPSRDGGFWLVVSNQIWHFNCRSNEWKPTSWSLPEWARGLTHMLEDRRGNVWLGTYGSGLLRFAPSGTVERLTADEGLTHNVVRALWEDREGNLWVGTDGGGLNCVQPRLVSMLGVREGLGGPVVMAIARDQQRPETVWAGLNGGGVNRLENGEVRPLIHEPLLSTNSFVYGLLADRSGGLWIGTYDSGVFRVDKGDVIRMAEAEGWARFPMLAGLEDRSGAVWFGGGFGLVRWRDGHWTDLNGAVGWSNVVVRALAEDRAGNVYVGSSGEGLLRYGNNQWTAYSKKDGLANDRITALYVDEEDTLWIGTWHGGVSRFKHGRFFTYSTRDGLPANCIASIVEDDSGDLWFGSNRGIFRIARKCLNDMAEEKSRMLSVDAYGIGDGLGTLECGGGAQPAACKGPDGKLWFATLKGVAMIDPRQKSVNQLAPPVIIEEVVVNDQTVVLDRPLALGARQSSGDRSPQRSVFTVLPGHHRLELRFTGLSFVAPEKVRFRYRLQGLDANWIDAGSRRVASYAHLPPGKYRFDVTACNNDGIWNQTGASLAIAVLPPWWMTWWFRIWAGVVAGGLLFYLMMLRWRRVQHEHSVKTAFAQRLIHSQEEERRRIAAELHDSIGQNLLVIKNRALFGLRDSESQSHRAEQLEEISKTATQSIQEVREISQNLRPYQIESLGLTKAVAGMVAKVSSASGLPCAVELEPVDGLLAPDSEIHLYRIVQELLNNVIKHSDASEVRVRLRSQMPSLILTIEDDGRGFDYDEVFGRPAREHGFGLADIAERVRILGGELECLSRPEKGTRWMIQIPCATQRNEKR